MKRKAKFSINKLSDASAPQLQNTLMVRSVFLALFLSSGMRSKKFVPPASHYNFTMLVWENASYAHNKNQCPLGFVAWLVG